MNKDVLSRLTRAGLLSDQTEDLGFVSTGSLALNKVVSGDFHKGIPIGYITQFTGESSTAKTAFVTHVLAEAQKSNYYTILIDSENGFSSKFATTLGIDPQNLLYDAPETIEDCFSVIETLIKEIRDVDSETPIVIGYDSIAVSPTREELESTSDYVSHNMIGAMRAKVTGLCLRRINTIIRKNKVALMIVNQIRNKVGVMYGDPTTQAAGGKALEYYLGVNLKTSSNKGDKVLSDSGAILGIRGNVKNVKNKVAIPFRECEFELIFNEGLTKDFGLLPMFEKEGLVSKSGSWYSFGDVKFQRKEFDKDFLTSDKYKTLRDKVNI